MQKKGAMISRFPKASATREPKIIGYTKRGRPVIEVAGGDGTAVEVPTIEALRTERDEVLREIDEILDTAHQDGDRALKPEEFSRHDELVARHAEIQKQIDAADATDRTASARSAQLDRLTLASIRFNTIGGDEPPHASRSLDELLWTSNEVVDAGSITRSGVFMPNVHGAQNPVEAMPAITRDGEWTPAPRMSEFNPDQREAIRRFQRTVSDMILFGFMVDKSAKKSPEAFQVARSHKRMKPRWEYVLRAMDVDTAAEGLEYVPTGLGAELHEKVRASGKVAPLFVSINLPTNPWVMPVEGADATAFLVAEPTADTATKVGASTPGSAKVTFDAEIFGGRVLFSRSLDADSAIAVLPFVRNKLVRAFVDAEEKAILDGDTAGTHQDSDVTLATDAKKAWDGLRKKAIAQTNADAGNVAVTLALFRSARRLMAKWGLNPADLVIICGVKVYYELTELAEVKTLDLFGPNAVILNGQLGALDGIPIVVSEHGRENLNATGVFDGVTTNRSYLLMVNKGEWALGQRMALDIEVDDSIYRESFQRVVVGFMREDFQNLGDAVTNEDTAILRNIA